MVAKDNEGRRPGTDARGRVVHTGAEGVYAARVGGKVELRAFRVINRSHDAETLKVRWLWRPPVEGDTAREGLVPTHKVLIVESLG